VEEKKMAIEKTFAFWTLAMLWETRSAYLISSQSSRKTSPSDI
jgi:hypothetical protein